MHHHHNMARHACVLRVGVMRALQASPHAAGCSRRATVVAPTVRVWCGHVSLHWELLHPSVGSPCTAFGGASCAGLRCYMGVACRMHVCCRSLVCAAQWRCCCHCAVVASSAITSTITPHTTTATTSSTTTTSTPTATTSHTTTTGVRMCRGVWHCVSACE